MTRASRSRGVRVDASNEGLDINVSEIDPRSGCEEGGKLKLGNGSVGELSREARARPSRGAKPVVVVFAE